MSFAPALRQRLRRRRLAGPSTCLEPQIGMCCLSRASVRAGASVYMPLYSMTTLLGETLPRFLSNTSWVMLHQLQANG
jgi:hypothetical protein